MMADGMVHYQTTVDPRYPAFQAAYSSIPQHRHGMRTSPMPPSPQQLIMDHADVYHMAQQYAAYANNQQHARVHQTGASHQHITDGTTDKCNWTQGHTSTASTGSVTASGHQNQATPVPAQAAVAQHTQKTENTAEAATAMQRFKLLQRQRTDAENGMTALFDQVMNEANKQQENCQSLNARLEREQARADSAEQCVNELKSTVAQLKQQLAAQESTAQENSRLQSELSKTRQQLSTANQQATDAANATKGMQDELKAARERITQLEHELSEAQDRASSAEAGVRSLQDDHDMWKDWCFQMWQFVPPHAHNMLNPAILQCMPPPAFPNQLPPHLAMPPMGMPPGMHPSMMAPMWMGPHGALPHNMWCPPPGMLHTPLPPQPTTTDNAFPGQDKPTNEVAPVHEDHVAAGTHPHDGTMAALAASNLGPATESSWASSQMQPSADTGTSSAASLVPTPATTEGGSVQQQQQPPAATLATHPSQTSSITEAASLPARQMSGQRLVQTLSTNSTSSVGDVGTPKDVAPGGARDTQKPVNRQCDGGRQGYGEGGRKRHTRQNRRSRAASDASGDISSGTGARSDQDSSSMGAPASVPAAGHEATNVPRSGGGYGKATGAPRGGHGGGRGRQGGGVPLGPAPTDQQQQQQPRTMQHAPLRASQTVAAGAGGRGQ